MRRILEGRPWPLDNVKIYGADGGPYGETADAIDRFWRNLLAGLASSRFHRPTAGIGLSEEAARNLRAARMVEQRARFWDLEPANSLLGERATDEAYLAARPGELYVLYFTDGGSDTVDLSAAAGELRLAWVDIAESTWTDEVVVEGGAAATLDAPGDGHWVAVIDRRP